MGEEVLGFLAHGVADLPGEADAGFVASPPVAEEGAVVCAEDADGVDGDAFDIAGAEPLAAEVFYEILGALVLEHARDLGGEVFAERAFSGEVVEDFVWGAGPEEVGEAGGEGVVV